MQDIVPRHPETIWYQSWKKFFFLYQEAERQKLHELLETETITASVLRYKLQYLPSDIKYEIQGIARKHVLEF